LPVPCPCPAPVLAEVPGAPGVLRGQRGHVQVQQRALLQVRATAATATCRVTCALFAIGRPGCGPAIVARPPMLARGGCSLPPRLAAPVHPPASLPHPHPLPPYLPPPALAGMSARCWRRSSGAPRRSWLPRRRRRPRLAREALQSTFCARTSPRAAGAHRRRLEA